MPLLIYFFLTLAFMFWSQFQTLHSFRYIPTNPTEYRWAKLKHPLNSTHQSSSYQKQGDALLHSAYTQESPAPIALIHLISYNSRRSFFQRRIRLFIDPT